MNVDFTDKVVLVTGASIGIGESTAILFAKLGAKLSIVGRNEENLRAVAAKCEKAKGVKPLAIVADLGTDEGVERTAKETLNHFGRFTTFEDKEWFVANFWKTATQELPDLVSEFPEEETFFVNFLREPIEPTGDEDEDFSTDAPKVYEELPSLVI